MCLFWFEVFVFRLGGGDDGAADGEAQALLQ
jgi:hypothetical protein